MLKEGGVAVQDVFHPSYRYLWVCTVLDTVPRFSLLGWFLCFALSRSLAPRVPRSRFACARMPLLYVGWR
jgi:hypothetical protein